MSPPCSSKTVSYERKIPRFNMWMAWSLAIAFTSAGCLAAAPDHLTVKTATGVYTGVVDPDFPDVRQFRSIPYAEPPLGKLRWLPPVPVRPSLRHSHASRFPPPCPQYLTRNLTVWNSNITNFAIRLHGQSRTAGAMAQTSSEDCLYLAIWTPRNATAGSKLPVALFIPGGSFVGGGVDVPYQQPAPWVQRTQGHVFVSANYRVNIAGFPWAAGLEVQNPGLLDLRAALEWVYANIAPFGGDPARITLWGHSAGGVAADMLAHAYPDDPLAAGLFLQSGTATVNSIADPDPAHSNFTFVARSLGCDSPSDPLAELACMRQVPMTLIQNFIGQYRDGATSSANTTSTPTNNNDDDGGGASQSPSSSPPLLPSLPPFRPIPDGVSVFRNYTLRASLGRLARIPALVSTTANEQASLTRYRLENVTAGPYRAAVDRETVAVFACLASNTTRARAAAAAAAVAVAAPNAAAIANGQWTGTGTGTGDVPITYRYEYAGNFSSLTPLGWMGAYHGSDVPMIMGTYERRGSDAGEVTDFQRRVARAMQEYVLAFMEDPRDGLRRTGWLPWGEESQGASESGGNGSGRSMMRFGSSRDGGVVAAIVSADEVDDACTLGKPYNSSP